MAACGEDHLPPAPGGRGSGGTGAKPQPCADGSERSCHITIGEHNGVLTCYEGTQLCSEGSWGKCRNGAVSNKAVSNKQASGKTAAALSVPAGCQGNPCDPTCQVYDEVPAMALVSTVASVFDWNVGDPNNPSPLARNEPCASAEDCQSNSYCDEPITGASCEHSKCEIGGGAGQPLDSTCDPCVDHVCAADSGCCNLPPSCDAITTAGGAQGYDLCYEDSSFCRFYMTNGTNSCQSVCNNLGASCAVAFKPGGVDGCSLLPDPSYSCASTGAADILCLCNKPAAGSWNSACVDAVKSECGAVCSTNTPPDETGVCKAWQAGESDADCAGVNLTVGITCDDGGTPSVPVCNVGTVSAPAGVELSYYAPGSGVIGNCAPPPAALPVGTCVTTDPIAPGDCVDVTTCAGLVVDSEIMVNPAGAAHVPECSAGACLDNWSIYQDGACEAPLCQGSTSVTNFSRVNMFVVVDRSGSMSSNGMWLPAMDGFKQFFADPNSKGLNVALRFFPDDLPVAGCNSVACDTTACETALVELGTLTADPAPTDAHEAALIAAINSKSAVGQTPTKPALDGALNWISNFATSHPDDTNVVVFVSDGTPTHCGTNAADIIASVAAAHSSANVLTYAVGLAGSNVSLMNGIAAAGGTGSYFPVSNSVTTTQQLVAAMEAIRGSGVSCSLSIPVGAFYDPALTQVLYEPGLGSQQALQHVADASACGMGGWYYDNNAAPTQVELCSNTCATVQGNADICNGANEFLDPGGYNCYRHDASVAGWNSARSDCLAWGGDLVTISSSAEQGFLNSVLGATVYWTGANDIASEGTFQWADGSVWGSYTNWEPSQPDNAGGGQDCTATSNGGQWYDYDCNSMYQYVCRKPVLAKQVTLALTCPQELKTTKITEVYEATCAPGQVVQWGYLTYAGVTPSDSSLVFDVRTANDVASLSAATYHYVTTAQSMPDTQVCALGSGCEGDLFNALGGLPAAQRSVLELQVTLTPTSDLSSSSSLNKWEILYSCPDDQ